jgi:hypothetical protein
LRWRRRRRRRRKGKKRKKILYNGICQWYAGGDLYQLTRANSQIFRNIGELVDFIFVH